MKIEITFEEIAKIVEEKLGQKLRFEPENGMTVKVSKEVTMPVIKIKKRIGIRVEIVGLEGHDLRLKAASDFLSWLVGKADGTAAKEYADIDGKSIVVHLDKIDSLQKVFDYIEPKSLNFSEEGAVLSAEIKL